MSVLRCKLMLMLKIELPEAAESALTSLAIAERRDLRRQAEVLILEGLDQRGLLRAKPGDAPDDVREPVSA